MNHFQGFRNEKNDQKGINDVIQLREGDFWKNDAIHEGDGEDGGGGGGGGNPSPPAEILLILILIYRDWLITFFKSLCEVRV